MTEKEKKNSKAVDEKRVKATVIRRRAAPAPPPAPPEETKPVEVKPSETIPVDAGLAAVSGEKARTPDAGTQGLKPAARPKHRTRAETKGGYTPKAESEKEDRPKGKGPKGRAVEARKEAAPKRVVEKSLREVLAEHVEEVFADEAVSGEAEAVPAAPEFAADTEEKPEGDIAPAAGPHVAHKKEVKVFQKEPEIKKFFTSRRAGKKGRFFQAKAQSFKGASAQSRPLMKTEITVPKAAKRVVRIVEAISVGDLSQRLGVKAGEIIKKLMGLGIMATVNQLLDVDAVTLIAQEYDYEIESNAVLEESLMKTGPEDAVLGDEKPRAPVVTVMGHVDHGKTSLLDAIRKTNVVSGEAGGITQHIGAYHVHLDKGDVTFLDTPGHEAFTAMRARGAKATDIVVLVVAADDGVMPQTIEAINHANAANVPIIVAINKIDLPGASPDKVKTELANYGLSPEEWGGQTIFVEVSAKKGIKIKELLEMILLQADVLELKASRSVPARGVVVEAKLDKGRGPVSTMLIQTGVLKTGDAIVTGVNYGRVRAMISDWGDRVTEAGPSMPIEILGLSGVPQAGDTFVAVKDEAIAKQIADMRQKKAVEKDRLKTAKMSLTELYDKITKGEVKELNLVIKADVHGSIEAVNETLGKLSTDAVKLKVIHGAVGGISEGDVMLASASNAIVIGFNVRPEQKAAALAEKERVDVRLYNIIYNLVDDIKNAMEGMLAPIVREEVVGRAEIRDVIKVSKVGNVAGCFVTDGHAVRGAKVRLVRDSVVIYDGRLSSLKRFKDDAKEVAAGYECGMTIEGYNDIKQGDVLELYIRKEEAAKL
ncbi:MAG: translation initiation factor IF-2 [Deltaproteobacteria bacterium]|nr:translation initiation factor IF-2 [Deltaproteobacteria bacterium]